MKAEVQNEGNIFLFRPLDTEAETWCDENLSDDRQSFGTAVVVEHRYIESVVSGFVQDGGEIE